MLGNLLLFQSCDPPSMHLCPFQIKADAAQLAVVKTFNLGDGLSMIISVVRTSAPLHLCHTFHGMMSGSKLKLALCIWHGGWKFWIST